ncbi:MAG TPA: hypothetical protein VG965_05185, partial [Patescibacteria group bacterium]|nr:hypothetical protein [Patescibacteria group bacterium]
MRILSIETSCDETSAAVVEKIDETNVRVLSNVTATSLALHATTGGIIPENAAREQIKFIIPVIIRALCESRSMNHESWFDAQKIIADDIDAIAVTSGPGLIGSLLVGVETARTLALALDKPIVPVNHLLAHLFANFIQPDLILNSIQDLEKEIPDRSRARNDKIRFPFIGLIVSGGHTDLLLFTSLTEYKWLGGTLDDAAGEALDKIGRLLNLSYPAGPEIEERAKRIKNTKVKFVSPMINSQNFDFSFSGLKSEASRFIQSHRHSEPRLDRGNLVSESQ